MSSGGPKMMERSYGVAGNGRKIKKLPVTHGGRRRRFTGPIPARPAAAGREILRTRSFGGGAPLSGACTVVVAGIGSHG